MCSCALWRQDQVGGSLEGTIPGPALAGAGEIQPGAGEGHTGVPRQGQGEAGVGQVRGTSLRSAF